MSNDINAQLLERAAWCIDYWVDKLPAQLIQRDLDSDDLEALSYHVAAAEAQASQLEFETNDAY